MLKTEILNKESKPVETVELPQEIFGAKVNKGLLHEVVRNHLANKRQGTAATKTRGKVRGGGRKPYRQKGSGRARAGSNRSPVWRGGGTVFGPQPRSYSYKLPKKVKWAALSASLTSRYSEGAVTIIDEIPVPEPKTKMVLGLLRGLGLADNVLIIVPNRRETLELAVRNIPNVDVARVGELNVYRILKYKKLLIEKGAVGRMKEVYLG
jgi:large subunit ribosomal protein L4